MKTLNIQEIRSINEKIMFYEQYLNFLVDKARNSPLYSKEEDQYFAKIRKIEEWINNAKKVKGDLYGTCAD